MPEAVLVDVVRTPSGRGKLGGALSSVHPVDLLAMTLRSLVARNDLDGAQVDDVIAGCVSQSGQQAANIARHAVLAAGLPEDVPATTVDRQCGSGQQAVHFAAQGVLSGAYDIVIACGVESMSRVAMGSPKGREDPWGPALRARYPEGLVNQGIASELVAARWQLARDDLDRYATRSHRLASQASADGLFDSEIVQVPVTVEGGAGAVHATDETIRPATSADALAELPPAFYSGAAAQRFPGIQWHTTAGNSSPLTDGAAAALIMSEKRAASLGLRPRARFAGFAVAADDPILMLTAPIPATRKVLKQSGLSLDQLDACEVNEAFASVPLAWARELGADLDRLNPRGGAIALGHPLGASGVRILVTLVNYLESTGGRFGLQTMCEGGGMANAAIIERI